jgi:CRP-like cAMP-binding protein
MGVRSISEKFLQFLDQQPFCLSLNEEEKEALARVKIVERLYPAGTLILEEGIVRRSLLLVSSGWALSFKSMADGRRLVADFPLRGDLLSSASILGTTYRGALAVTNVTTFELALDREPLPMWQMPLLVRPFIHLLTRNFGIATEHLANIARRPPIERTAHLFLEMRHRLQAAGLADGQAISFSFPFTQSDVADALGLTAIHTNRVLRDLREDGLLIFRGAAVQLLDLESLCAMAQFDASYLALGKLDSRVGLPVASISKRQ